MRKIGIFFLILLNEYYFDLDIFNKIYYLYFFKGIWIILKVIKKFFFNYICIICFVMIIKIIYW